MSKYEELREEIARQIWMDDTGSDTGWYTSYEFVHKSGHCYNIADQILPIVASRCVFKGKIELPMEGIEADMWQKGWRPVKEIEKDK